MQRSRIVGTGTYLPARKVTNDDLVKEFGINTTDAWIRERTGIGARRIAAPDEATSDMATAASRKELEMAGIAPAELDMIVVGTVESSPSTCTPTGRRRTSSRSPAAEARSRSVATSGRSASSSSR